jgi:nucleoside-diphosphate-sugar epimerase
VTVVVTGAAGFIGSHLVERLAAAGHDVAGIDRRDAIPPVAEPVVADLLDGEEAVEDALREATAVFHLAGAPGVRDAAPRAPARRRRDNVLATAAVLALVPRATPLVVTSSSSVYGGALHGGVLRPSHEDDPLRPRGGYAAAKAEVERLCRERLERGGAVTIARPFTVAGERQRRDMAIATWLDEARRGRPIRLFGSGSRTRDVTDVHDVVQALVAIAERGVPGVVNVGTGAPVTLAEIASAVLDAVGSEAGVVVEPAPDVDPPATFADTTRCRKVLGFVPSIDLTALVGRQLAAAVDAGGRRAVAVTA